MNEDMVKNRNTGSEVPPMGPGGATDCPLQPAVSTPAFTPHPDSHTPGGPTGAVNKALSPKEEMLRILGILIRRAWVAVIFLIITMVVGILVTWRQTPVYQAKTTVIIDTRSPQILSDIREVVDLGTGNYWSNLEYFETQYKVINSRKIAQMVAEEEGLAQDLDFLGLTGIQDQEKLRAALESSDPVKILLSRIQVLPQKGSRVVSIAIKDPNPERARRLANGWADAYIKSNMDERTLTTVGASETLAIQFEELQKKLADSEEALFRFKETNRILDASFEEKQSLTTKKLHDFTGALNKLEGDKIRLRARLDSLKSLYNQPDAERTLDGLLENTVLKQLRQSQAELITNRSELLTRYMAEHPAVRAVDAQLKQIRAEMDKELASVIRSLESELEALMDTEKGFQTALEEVKQEAQTLAYHEITYKRLAREEEINRKLFDTVLNRLKETGLSSEISTNNVRILDYALAPTSPISPNKSRNLLLTFLIGLMGGIGLAFLIDILDNTIKVPEDGEELGVAFLGVIPMLKDASSSQVRTQHRPDIDLHIIQKPRSSVAECFRTVRTNLTFMATDGEFKRLMVTSASPKEGKSFVAANLAISMAASGKKVLLIDSDMRRPRQHTILNLSRHMGVTNVIAGNYKPEQVIQTTIQPGLHFMASGPIPPNPAELLHSRRFSNMLDELSNQYHMIILDSPPVLAVTDALITGNMVDGTIFVTRSRTTTKELAKRAIQQLLDVGAPVLGMLLNGFDTSDKSYGHHHYQYQRYGDYYIDDDATQAQMESESGPPFSHSGTQDDFS